MLQPFQNDIQMASKFHLFAIPPFIPSSLLHCDALSRPNQITPGRQSGVRGCLVNRQQFLRLIYSLGVTLWVLLYVHLTAEGMLI